MSILHTDFAAWAKEHGITVDVEYSEFVPCWFASIDRFTTPTNIMGDGDSPAAAEYDLAKQLRGCRISETAEPNLLNDRTWHFAPGNLLYPIAKPRTKKDGE